MSPERTALPVRALLHRTVVLTLLSWLLWQGSAATFLLAWILGSPRAGELQRALSGSEEQRILWTLSERDQELEQPPGYHLGLYRALQEHVGPRDTVLVQVEGNLRDARVVAPLPALVFPRAIRPGPLPAPERLLDADSLFVLDFRNRFRERLEPAMSAVAAGPDWTLWH